MTAHPPRGAEDGNDPQGFREFPRSGIEQAVCARFEEQARRFAPHPAVESDSREVSYGDLDREANRIAREILACCGPGEGRVALIFRRASALVPALLGVLKAGKVYVPVDPSYPATRVEYILEDSDASLVLSDGDTAPLTRKLVPATRRVLNVDEVREAPSAERPPVDISPDQIATILYTSGSTGAPKGVMQSHRNLLQHVRNYTNNLRIRRDDRVSLLFSYSFSASLLDIFGALLNGATLCPFDVRSEGTAGLVRWVESARITHLHLVPSLYRRFLGALTGKEQSASVRRVDVAGEALHGSDVAAHRRSFSEHCLLVYRFAASEASFITHHEIGPQTEVAEGAVPVGLPAEGMEILIQDGDGANLGAGAVGEIVLRSAYLCPGYWRKPDLTAKAFSPDPVDGHLRRYRTGDLGRLRADGFLEHLGRGDTRVKIRGFTVDRTEVETALRALEGVRDAVVLARDEGLKTADLVAFAVPDAGAKLVRSALRISLLELLPDYMVPAVVVPTPSLPLTPTGKVDHSALSEMASEATERGAPPTPPRDELESALAGIWREALDLETLGVLDDFYELGGDSLAAVEIVTRIESELGQAVPTTILHLAPTIEELATRLRTMESVRSDSLALPFRAHGSAPPLFAIPGRGGDPIVFAYLAQNLGPDRPFYGLATPGLTHQQPIPRSFEELAAIHLEEVRKIQPEGPYFLLGFSSGAMVAFELGRQLQARGETVAFLGSLDGWAPGFPKPLPGRSWLQRLADLGPGRAVILRRKTGLGTTLKQTLKDLARELACRVEEAVGRPLSRTQRYRRIKRRHTRERTEYRPAPVPTRMTLFRAADPGVPGLYRHEPLYGWDAFAEVGVDVYDFPGEHDDLVYEPTVCLVAKQLDECMAKCGPSSASAELPLRETP
jgi:amino acid adenylation domain-containing protein